MMANLLPARSAHERENTPWIDRYADMLVPGMRVLDLGSGTGDDTRDLIAFGGRVVAVDIDLGRLRQVPVLPGVLGLVQSDMTQGLPFSGRVFDVVSASLSLHYFDSATTLSVVGDIARILPPDGMLILRVNAAGDVNFGYSAGPEIEPGLFLQPDGRIKRFFTPDMLEQFLEPCFTVRRVSPRTIKQHGRAKRTLECLAVRTH